MTFGLPHKSIAPRAELTDEPIAAADKDSDGDGIPDRIDACPNQAETVNGVADDDGCPESDPDGDGIIGAADKCPDQPEDFDHFQDEDGCPDLDNDSDGIPDARDQCPNQPEVFNGIDDDDGCPDTVPAPITAALLGTTAVRFEPRKARITDAARKALERTLAILRDRPNLRVVVTGHPENAAGEDLAKKRAEAVKWYLVDQGIAADQLMTTVGEPSAPRAPMIEITLAITPPR
jgi:OOP family OmpA-OmpF porin